jgi:DNA-binding NarL/FixJ family response regulator
MNRVRVLLADDHAVLRAGLRLLLEAEPNMVVIGEAADGRQAVTMAQELRPDVLLLDLTMPRLGGLDALGELRRLVPECRVLVLTMHNDEGYLRRALAAGAAGYVLKQADDRELLVALRAVVRGEVYVPPALAPMLLEDLLPQRARVAPSAQECLSDREEEVIRLVAQGYTSQEVADQLSLAVSTVETYRARAMQKLGLHGRVQLVRYALQAGWLREESGG